MRRLAFVLVLVGSLLPQVATNARAVHCGPEAGGLTCTDIGGTDVAGDCTLSTTFTCTADTIINIPGSLTITAGDGIDCSGDDGAPGAPGQPGDPGFDLTLNVGGDLNLAGTIATDGGTGGSGTPGQPGGIGGLAGNVDIDVCGDVDIVAGAGITATGGSGGPGGSGSSIVPNGGNGNVGGTGGTIDIDADGSLTMASGSAIDAAGGPGGAGGAGGTNNGNGGFGANAGLGGAVLIFSCATDIDGLVGAGGGTGGSGGSGGGTTGDGGINGNGANAGIVTIESGSDLFIRANAHIIVSGGNEGAVGGGNPPGSDVASGGNGGTFTTNNCPTFTTDVDAAALIETQGGSEDGLPGSTVPLEDAPCCPCAINIVKEVALDDDCDGAEDGPFQDSVTQDNGECVVYRICVTNTGDVGAGAGDHPQVIEDVLVDDGDLGINDANFGDLAPGDTECRLIPSEAPATDCPGPSGDVSDDNCICEDVEGINTAVVDSAACAVDGSDACLNPTPPGPDSDCDDTAEVDCIGPCSVDIDKTVALDDNCDGTADGPFIDSVTQDANECVIYRICVENTGSQILNATGVKVSDAHLGIVNLDFGTINPTQTVCKDIPVDASAPACPTGDCICSDVEGTNTAVISAAVCEDSQENACDQAGSNCDDDAEVDCTTTVCPLDHFKCYRAKSDSTFAPRTVTLADQFEDTSASVLRPRRLCNPADKNGSGITDPTAHLMCYDIAQDGPFTRRHVLVNNQFGQQEFIVLRPFSLCNPATKDQVPSALNLDHFKCYRIKRATGSLVVNETVTVTDQFETRTSQVFKPHILCNPVSKNNSGIEFPDCHLTCYRLRGGTSTFTSQSAIVEDQFGTVNDLNAFRGVCSKVDYLCVPSSKTELP